METLFNFVLLAGILAGVLYFIGTQLPTSTIRPTSKRILTPPKATLLSLHEATLCRSGINAQSVAHHRSF